MKNRIFSIFCVFLIISGLWVVSGCSEKKSSSEPPVSSAFVSESASGGTTAISGSQTSERTSQAVAESTEPEDDDSEIYYEDHTLENPSSLKIKAGGAIVYTNSAVGYTLEFPASWKDRFEIYIENGTSDVQITFKGQSTEIRYMHPFFFNVRVGKMGEDELFETELLGKKDGKDIFAESPTDSQAEILEGSDYPGEYAQMQTMTGDVPKILKSFKKI